MLIISNQNEKIVHLKNSYLSIEKELNVVFVKSNGLITNGETSGGRIFNFMPGLEAISLKIEMNEVGNLLIKIEVIPNKI